MSNETPQADGEPTQLVPETPAPEAPAPGAPVAAGEDDVVEAPTVATPATPTAATPVAGAAAADRPAGIFVPKWVGIVAAAIVAAFVFGGIGYAIGDSSGDSNSQNASNLPGTVNGNRNGPFANGQRPGNGQLPGSGNSNGTENGNGSSNGNRGGGQTSGDTAFLGVALGTAANGVGVTDVQSGSAAANAGLKTGDVITAVDGTNVTTAAALASAIQQHSSGDQITVTYTRDGKSTTAKVTLGSRTSTQSN